MAKGSSSTGAAEARPAADLEIEPGAGAPERSQAARRALAEAEERRFRSAAQRPRELAGRGGLDPIRYGDWEIKGLASDF